MADEFTPKSPEQELTPPKARRGRPTKAEVEARRARGAQAPVGAQAAINKAIEESPEIKAALTAEAGLGSEAKDKFVAIMWRWIRDYEDACDEPVYLRGRNGKILLEEDGSKTRDYKAEFRRQEVKMVMAQKAASILRVAFIAEKVEVNKLEELPLQGLPGYVAGWMQGAKGKPEQEEDFDA